MKSKFLISLLIVFNLSVLVLYNNCGQLSHSEKTSTQATNPGDFGGDSEDAAGDHDIYFTSLVTTLCNRIMVLDATITFTECYSQIYASQDIAHIFHSDASTLHLDHVISKLYIRELLRSVQKSNACMEYLLNLTPDNPSFQDFKLQLNNYFELYQVINPKSIDYGTAILSSHTSCATLVREP